MNPSFRFKNRVHAGKLLSEDPKIKCLLNQDPIVLALPRGGVPIGFEIAKAINAPLDVMIVRKLGIPYQPEVAFGAISLNGVQVLNLDFIHRIGLSENDMNSVILKETKELERRNSMYRGDRPFPCLEDRIVLMVSQGGINAIDGIATGATIKAAILAVKKLNARKIIACCPVGPTDSVQEIKEIADEVICPHQPYNFHAVGLWYESFPQTTDEEVISILKQKFKEE